MRFIVDTNRIIAGLLRDSTTRQILLHPLFEFHAPDFLLLEIERHKELILRKSSLSESAFQIIFDLLIGNIEVVPMSDIKNHLIEAEGVIGQIDPDDVAFIALALAIRNDGIWSEDNDFRRQDRIKIWSTGDILTLMKE